MLLHDLEQRRLHLRRRAVDLVGEQEVAEDRAELDVEAARVGPVDARADEVGGHEVGRELDAPERAAHDVGERADRQRLGEAGHALEQHVAAGQQRDEQPLEHRVLADDDALDLVQRLLERLTRRAPVVLVGWRGGCMVLIGAGSFRSGSDKTAKPEQRQQRAAGQQSSAPPLKTAVSSRSSSR